MEHHSDNLGRLLHEAARATRRVIEQRIEPLGLSSAQGRLLFIVNRFGEATQARIADILDIEPISVSRMVDRMEAAGWVERHPDPTDRRVRQVRPTEQARLAYAKIKPIAQDIYDEAVAGLPAADRKVFMRSLAAVVERLNHMVEPALEGAEK